jgi:DMSO/TMAO reductase YedYZ molybdopterin-dependent catalytic subunit
VVSGLEARGLGRTAGDDPLDLDAPSVEAIWTPRPAFGASGSVMSTTTSPPGIGTTSTGSLTLRRATLELTLTQPLPPGQRERADFPRFGLTPFRDRFPRQTERAEVQVLGDVAQPIEVPDLFDTLPRLARVEQTSDFHCVTTWSSRGLRWSGVRFREFHAQVVVPQAGPAADAQFVILRGQDGARTCMWLEDLLADDVLLADQLDGQPLTVEHGAPLRLVAPAHYGYKSVKYLCRIEYRSDESAFKPSAFRFMDHLRARVAREERGRGVPGWLLRHAYRPLIARTVRDFERSMRAARPGGLRFISGVLSACARRSVRA